MKINFQKGLQSRMFWKSLSLLLLVGMFFTFNQCVVQQFDAPVVETSGDVDKYHDEPVNSGGTLPPGGSGEFEEQGATDVARLITDIGVKDFEAIYFTYQVLTGVRSQDNSTVRNAFQDLRSQLPYDNTIKSFGTAHQIAVVKLASEFCNTLFDRSNYYNIFFNNFNISQTPNNGLDAAGKLAMVQELIGKFWGVNVQPDAVEQNAISEMLVLIDDLLDGENLNSTTTTRKIAKGVCTSLLASAPVTTL